MKHVRPQLSLSKYIFLELFWALVQASVVFAARSEHRLFLLFPLLNTAYIVLAVIKLPKGQSWESVNLHLPTFAMWIGIIAGLTPIFTDTWDGYTPILLLGAAGTILCNIIIFLWFSQKGFTKTIQYREIGLSIFFSFFLSISFILNINNLSDISSKPHEGQVIDKYISAGKGSSYRLRVKDTQDATVIDFRVNQDIYQRVPLYKVLLYRTSQGLLRLKRHMIISEL